MEKLHLKMLALMLLIGITATGQPTPEVKRNYSLKEFAQNKKDFQNTRFKSDYYLNFKFSTPLTVDQQEALAEAGVDLIQSTGDQEYLVACNKGVKRSTLAELGVQQVIKKTASDKLSVAVKGNEIPTWAQIGDDRVKVSIVFNNNVGPYEIQTILEEYDADVVPNENFRGFIQLAELYLDQLTDLANHPLVNYVDFLQEPDKKLNFENRIISRVNTVQNNSPGSLNLYGEGVCIGIGDGGELGSHNDFGERVINKANGTYSSFGAHGDHVAGIVGGAGYVNPRHKGIAPKSELIIQKTSLISYYTESYFDQYNMVLTNNSYGTTAICEQNGTYNYTSIGLDNQLNEFDEVLHVFAAGNSGSNTCGDFPKGFRTVLRFYQAAKNVLTVGNLKDTRVINNNSSRGPVLDGRLKPEIVSVGTSVMSTGREYNYYNSSGTSMSAPTVTGILGLMYERYRQLNGGSNPKGALMKAVACNTADDLGNPGPDFTHGYGMINTERAIEVINEGNYYDGTLTNGSSASQVITVPANTSELKVMLSWADVEGVLNASKALVNDLDLAVITPSETLKPWVLNPAPANVEDNAQRAYDRLNNLEQVTIDNPVAGDYTINVSAFNIPLGAQDFWVTYEFVSNETSLTHPMGGETFESNKRILIEWKSAKDNSSPFNIDWSSDNGSTWQTVQHSVPATTRFHSWMLPEIYTENALVRVTKSATGEQVLNNKVFSIIPEVSGLLVEPGCAHSLHITWDVDPSISKYKILQLNEDGFEEIGETTFGRFDAVGAYMPGDEYWFAVQGITNTGAESVRSVAKKGMVISGIVCDWKNDGVVFVPEFTTARAETADSLSGEHFVTAKVFNAGTNTLNQFEVRFRINNYPVVSQTFYNTIASGDSLEVTFSQSVDLSAPGDYEIESWMVIPGDTHIGNDYLPAVPYAVQLPNDNINLPNTEEFDDYIATFNHDVFAVDGFKNIDLFVGQSGEVYFGKADNRNLMSLKPNAVWQQDVTYAKARITYNMEEFFRSVEPVYMGFDHRGHSLINIPGWPSNDNLLQVRGSDQDDWITIHTFEYDAAWDNMSGINLSQALIDANQNFTSSFQIQFVQDALFGLYIDDIELTSGIRLPVNWGDFSLKGNEDGHVDVNWSTYSEIENNHFEVQVANNSNNDLDFKTIGLVSGQGTTDRINQYHFVDTTPNKSGIRYYRIKQVDFDGTTTYTEIRQLRFSELSTKVTAYPNPAMDDLFVTYSALQKEDVTIQLVDLTGRVLLSQEMHFTKGNHDFPIQIDEMPAGFYTLNFVREGRIPQAIRIQKIRD